MATPINIEYGHEPENLDASREIMTEYIEYMKENGLDLSSI
jgi:hypothetical protein